MPMDIRTQTKELAAIKIAGSSNFYLCFSDE